MDDQILEDVLSASASSYHKVINTIHEKFVGESYLLPYNEGKFLRSIKIPLLSRVV